MAEWTGRLVEIEHGRRKAKTGGSRRFVGVPGMNAIAAHLAIDCDVRSGIQVEQAFPRHDRWYLEHAAGEEARRVHAARVLGVATILLMPEGPEIRLAADRIASAIAGKTAREVWFAFDDLKRWESRLSGRRVRAVEPRGKAMLVRFSGGVNLYSHNQLYGRWYVTANGAWPRTNRQLRVALHTRDASALLYSASDIDVLSDRQLKAQPYLARLGADVLDKAVTRSVVRSRLDDARFARRGLGGLLLDQGFLGGIGNYLRSEILFVACIDPSRRPCDLGTSEKAAFARAALGISRRAYRTRGITNAPSIVSRLRKAGLRRSEYRHFVFGRDGQPCYTCESTIEKLQVAGRRLYACRTCQQ